ncbi:hypothetical protein psageB2_058 [Pseudomonas phage psageB2]|nr:hypothetical protein psageB2_058 [Pseudomonas phage psageB2]
MCPDFPYALHASRFGDAPLERDSFVPRTSLAALTALLFRSKDGPNRPRPRHSYLAGRNGHNSTWWLPMVEEIPLQGRDRSRDGQCRHRHRPPAERTARL